MEDNKLIIYKNSNGAEDKALDKKSVTEKCSLTADDGGNYS
ncbi:MAG: hypothetical protein Q4C44_00465 [bacterium]|nr:hypothetical protein [bacterium]